MQNGYNKKLILLNKEFQMIKLNFKEYFLPFHKLNILFNKPSKIK